MVLCDGGNKPPELKVTVDIAKPGDFVLAQDYAPSRRVFKSKIHGKRWNRFEIADADLPSRDIKSIESPKLRDAMWFGGVVGLTHPGNF